MAQKRKSVDVDEISAAAAATWVRLLRQPGHRRDVLQVLPQAAPTDER
jgi:hypothetical protein